MTQWNRMRTGRVVEFVEKWCAENSVPLASVMDTGSSSVHPQQIAPHTRIDESVRHQVLDALARMTTEELLEIPIPAKHLIGGIGK